MEKKTRKIKIEIQITILTVIIATVVATSGYFVYQSLSGIVSSFQNSTRPDFKLILIKDIRNDLTLIENNIRLYNLSKDPKYAYTYKQLKKNIHQKLNNLQDYSIPQSSKEHTIDSILFLTDKKLDLLERIKVIHQKQEQVVIPLDELYSKIDTAIIQPDTITFPKTEKKGFFKRIFSRDNTTHPSPVIIDNSAEKAQLKQEINRYQNKVSQQKKQFQGIEQQLYQQNVQLTQRLRKLITTIEQDEQEKLDQKTQEADMMAAQTYRRITIFSIAVIILLIVVLFLFFRNMKQNQLYQKILKQSKIKAEELAKAKELFIATVSHEMRTPVNAIFGLSEQLIQKRPAEEFKKDLSIIHQSATHLATIVNDTLDFSKMDAEKLALEKESFSPTSVIEMIAAIHEPAAKSKGLELVIDNQLPQNMTAIGDPVRLKQILINLLTNALKFTEKGSVWLRVAYRKNESSDFFTLLLEVEDSGIGMSENDQKKIFEEFVQLDNDKAQKHKGTGLGLAIVKKLIDLHHGKINIKSTPGKGSCFSIEIPYQYGEEDSQPIQSKILPVPNYFSELSILIVDDEEFNRYLLKGIFNKWSVHYLEAKNGQEAIDLAIENDFDLILMDVRMPVVNGFDASKMILQSKPETKIIALTATSQQTEIEKLNTIGINGFLQKPFSEKALLKSIETAISPDVHPNDKKEVLDFQSQDSEPFIREINLEKLLKQMNNDKQFFVEMIQLFIRSAHKAQTKIEDAIQSNNWKEIAETAHKLAAPSKHMMANQLYQLLKQLESEADQGTNSVKIIELSHICLKHIIEICKWLQTQIE